MKKYWKMAKFRTNLINASVICNQSVSNGGLLTNNCVRTANFINAVCA